MVKSVHTRMAKQSEGSSLGREFEMQLFPGQLAIANLKRQLEEDDRGFMSVEEAVHELRQLSGLDFGKDIEKWESWVKLHYRSVDELKANELRGGT